MAKRAVLYIISIMALLVVACNDEETNGVEPRVSYAVRNIYWTHRIDSDQDGYASSGSINVEVDLGSSVNKEIHVRLFYKGANETVWTYLQDKTATIISNKNDAVIFNGIASAFYYGLYDFRVIVTAYQGSNLLFYADVKPDNHPLLKNQKFEYDGEDLRSEP